MVSHYTCQLCHAIYIQRHFRSHNHSVNKTAKELSWLKKPQTVTLGRIPFIIPTFIAGSQVTDGQNQHHRSRKGNFICVKF